MRAFFFALILTTLAASPCLAREKMGSPEWKQVDQLVSEQKFQAALDATMKVLGGAKKDARLHSEALVKATQLEMALHGYETAVRFLKDSPWPEDKAARALLSLYHAQSLMYYQQSYGWEIGQREKTAGAAGSDLKTWTTARIGEEISKSFDAAMAFDEGLDAPVPEWFRFALRPNSYPKGIRPLLRDAVAYLAVQHLVNQQFWAPAESNEVYKLGFDRLARLTEGRRIPAAAPGKHPLEKAATWLAELSAFHSVRGESEAALEARYELLEALHAAATEAADRASVREALRALQASAPRAPWWARGQALLAEMIRAEERPGNLIDARREALAGRDAFPASPGGEMCAVIVHEIERPEQSTLSMQADAPGKRSLLVEYRNLRKLYFRAFKIDFEARLRSGKGNNFLQPDAEELLALSKQGGAAVAAAWSADLPETTDYSRHRFFVTPPKLAPGAYVIVSSLGPDFGLDRNQILAVRMLVTSLVLGVSRPAGRGVEARVSLGENGKPAEQVEITMYRFNWQSAPEAVAKSTTGPDGLAELAEPSRAQNENWSYFLVGRRGGELAFDNGQLWFGRAYEEASAKWALLFTDRAIYRPGQKVHFKVVGYSGKRAEGKYQVGKAGDTVKVRLMDPNYQVAAEKTLKLGAFGSASGEFTVPAGKPLGAWQLQASAYAGHAQLKVEEYKRPTFEASFKEAAAPLRLNRKATLHGEARYYFGLPVTAGKVSWRVTRAEVAPWWWGFRGWWFPGGNRAPDTVASGTASLRADGGFQLEFTPEADERKAGEGISYNFQVEADITDEGGETRSASRTFRLGFVAVEARLDLEEGFLRVGQGGVVQARLSDLDGKPLKGQGSWELSRLEGELKLPAELPPEAPAPALPLKAAAASEFRTPGDLQRARWETAFRWESVAAGWKAAEKIAEGSVAHDEKGAGRINLKALARSGVYRLTYRTKDSFGAAFKASREFVVAATKPEIPLPLLLLPERGTVKVGETARFLVHSGLAAQPVAFEVFLAGKRVSRKVIEAGKGGALIEVPVSAEHRGGFTVVASGVRDFQSLRSESNVSVPWSDRELKVEFSTFRDKIRPGAKETFRVTVKSEKGNPLAAGAAEVLAYMYDRSLDLFAPHSYPEILSLYPGRTGAPGESLSLGVSHALNLHHSLPSGPSRPHFVSDTLEFYPSYGVGGPGGRGRGGLRMAAMSEGAPAGEAMLMDSSASAGAPAAPLAQKASARGASMAKEQSNQAGNDKVGAGQAKAADVPLRSNFSEQAFFAPHLVTGQNGATTIEFTAPDSVTSWNVLAHAFTRDLRGGSASRETRTVKELMVRPYIPRFLREGDQAEIRVQVNNASDSPIEGELSFDIEDAATGKSALAEFGLNGPQAKKFQVAKGGSATLGFPVKAPKKVGDYAFRVVARSKGFSDGELRPFPMLPSRMHLAQSRFVTLKGKDAKTLEFKDLAKGDDPTLLNDKMVVTVDGQLFYGVLQALPYLVSYPYECAEQTLNRFLSTGIVMSVYDKYPGVAKMAKDFASRNTQLEKFDGEDPNRRMSLEETPWLQEAKGGRDGDDLVNVLKPEVARAHREEALAKLRKLQLPGGGFPWFQGGPADEHMTLYLLLGLARAVEFKVEVPQDLVAEAWGFVRGWLDRELARWMNDDSAWEQVTLLNFALSSYPSDAWTGGHFDAAYRRKLLDFSFKHWKQHSPLLKGYLALTLKRMDRAADAKLVWDSVMDSAKNDAELGTYWAREDRSWLWYNDDIETHAFALRAQMELDPKDKHNEGLVQWLFLNKKLNHWKSTRATAEVIYSLVHYLDKNNELGQREAVKVKVGNQVTEFAFEPEKYTGKKNQIVVPGEKVGPATAKVEVSKETKGFAFASATWHFSTEKLPEEERGDFFNVSRRYFRRVHSGGTWQLEPLAEGAKISVGDQLEVQISLRAKHAAEYVHLRDPRGAGFEPESLNSGYKWDLGIFWYEETRDSGSNFFFSSLPVGEYTFKYRVRANMAGTFRVGPATVQSMYAPEFNAYSKGAQLRVEPARE